MPLENQILFTVRPMPLLMHDLVQTNIRHIGSVVVGKDGISEIKDTRTQPTRSKVLQQGRFTLHVGIGFHLAEALEAVVH